MYRRSTKLTEAVCFERVSFELQCPRASRRKCFSGFGSPVGANDRPNSNEFDLSPLWHWPVNDRVRQHSMTEETRTGWSFSPRKACLNIFRCGAESLEQSDSLPDPD